MATANERKNTIILLLLIIFINLQQQAIQPQSRIITLKHFFPNKLGQVNMKVFLGAELIGLVCPCQTRVIA